ncbi:sensor histidine kinase [Microbacterium awajiense]|uniref:sensor histidine kinase n=1 Tax=Microbacterium awajiense TaxID=415214 RepID=UPI0031D1BBD7
MLRPLKTYQVVVDLVVAAAFLVLVVAVEGVTAFTVGLYVPAASYPASLSSLLIALPFTAALAVRRLSPGLSLGLAWAGALLQMGLGWAPSVADLAIFGVLYAVAAYGGRAVYWAGLVSALAGGILISLYLVLGPPFSSTALTWQTLPVVLTLLVAAVFALGLAWTIGALVRTGIRAREDRENRRRAEAEAAAEQERVRIARDMHDVVAHSLAVVVAQADGARYAAASDPAVATQALGTISATARSALSDVRMLLTQLRLREGDGPQPTFADLPALFEQVRGAGVDLAVDVDLGDPARTPSAVQLAAYRILQEALTNALRHGDGGPVAVRLRSQTGQLHLEVRNGLRGGVDAGWSGHGLIGMGERASLVGGRLNAAAEDADFVVTATLPARETS